ncbi:MAG: NUDIX domain-containing protein [Acidimicrobiales bacterium]
MGAPGAAEDRGDGDLPAFRTLGEETIFEGHVFGVHKVRVEDPAGEEFERDVVRHPGAVSIVPLHGDGTVTLVRQHRTAIGSTVLEAPAGTCDEAGEDVADTARRELAEEAGLSAGHIEPLGEILNSPGYTDQRTRLYLATALEPCESAPAGIEERWLTLERVPLSEVEALVAAGRLSDATTIVGLLLARAATG